MDKGVDGALAAFILAFRNFWISEIATWISPCHRLFYITQTSACIWAYPNAHKPCKLY